MSNDVYVYCLQHRESMDCAEWLALTMVDLGEPDGIIADVEEFLEEVWREAADEVARADPPSPHSMAAETALNERRYALLGAFLARHQGCQVAMATSYGSEEALEALHEAQEAEGGEDEGDGPPPWTEFEFYSDRLHEELHDAWSPPRPPRTINYGVDLVEQLRQSPLGGS